MHIHIVYDLFPLIIYFYLNISLFSVFLISLAKDVTNILSLMLSTIYIHLENTGWENHFKKEISIDWCSLLTVILRFTKQANCGELKF